MMIDDIRSTSIHPNHFLKFRSSKIVFIFCLLFQFTYGYEFVKQQRQQKVQQPFNFIIFKNESP